MKLKHAKKNAGFTLVELLVVIAIIASLAAISSPIIIKQIAKSRATQAVSNSKDIYVGLRDYNIKFGQLPPAATNTNTSMLPVFNTKQIVDEKPFFVKGLSSYGAGAISEGDGDISADTTILEPGSCAFTYWAESTTAGVDITVAAANTPVLTCPQEETGATAIEDAEFYTADFGGQAVILSADGGATIYQIEEGTTAGQGVAMNETASGLVAIDPALNVGTTVSATLVSVPPEVAAP